MSKGTTLASPGAVKTREPSAFLHTRDEVLRCIKSLLQPAYDKGILSRAHFISVAKQTLLFVMSTQELGVRRYSRAFVAQVVQLQLMHVESIPLTHQQQQVSLPSPCAGSRGCEKEVSDGCIYSRDDTAFGDYRRQNAMQLEQQHHEQDPKTGSHDGVGVGHRQSPFRASCAVHNDGVHGNDRNARNYFYPSVSAHHTIQSRSLPCSPTMSQGNSRGSRITTTSVGSCGNLRVVPQLECMPPSLQQRGGDAAEETVQQRVDGEDTSLLRVVGELRKRLATLHPKKEDNFSLSGLVGVTGRSDKGIGLQHQGPSSNLTPAQHTSDNFSGPTVTPASVLDNILNSHFAPRDLFQEWSLERQEILREEENTFTSLLLQLQHSLLASLIRCTFDMEKAPLMFTLPPPPTTPPPRVQFERDNGIHDDGRDGSCSGKFAVWSGSWQQPSPRRKVGETTPRRQATATNSPYTQRFFCHNNSSRSQKSPSAEAAWQGSTHNSSRGKANVEIQRVPAGRGNDHTSLPLRAAASCASVVVVENCDSDTVNTPIMQRTPPAVFLRRNTLPSTTTTPLRGMIKRESATVRRIYSPPAAKPTGTVRSCSFVPVMRFSPAEENQPRRQPQSFSPERERGRGNKSAQVNRGRFVKHLPQMPRHAFNVGTLFGAQLGNAVGRAVGKLLPDSKERSLLEETVGKKHLRGLVDKRLAEAP